MARLLDGEKMSARALHMSYLPVTDDVVRWPLSGHDDGGLPLVAGVYPMLQDETSLDFDKDGASRK